MSFSERIRNYSAPVRRLCPSEFAIVARPRLPLPSRCSSISGRRDMLPLSSNRKAPVCPSAPLRMKKTAATKARSKAHVYKCQEQSARLKDGGYKGQYKYKTERALLCRAEVLIRQDFRGRRN